MGSRQAERRDATSAQRFSRAHLVRSDHALLDRLLGRRADDVDANVKADPSVNDAPTSVRARAQLMASLLLLAPLASRHSPLATTGRKLSVRGGAPAVGDGLEPLIPGH
eukprot:763408-Prymnesium_polylepis.2